MKISKARMKKLAAGDPPSRTELTELIRLAEVGQATEQAPQMVVLSAATGGPTGKVPRYTLRVDTPIEPPISSDILGHRVRIVAEERVLKAWRRGDRLPKDRPPPLLEPGVAPPRDWPEHEAEYYATLFGKPD